MSALHICPAQLESISNITTVATVAVVAVITLFVMILTLLLPFLVSSPFSWLLQISPGRLCVVGREAAHLDTPAAASQPDAYAKLKHLVSCNSIM